MPLDTDDLMEEVADEALLEMASRNRTASRIGWVLSIVVVVAIVLVFVVYWLVVE
ncbi:MAG: hypothetical protein OXI69_17590 [Acidobacteriota bacterium]|nr:hypothetical protein [Acidobacteriota bacterium]